MISTFIDLVYFLKTKNINLKTFETNNNQLHRTAIK